MFAQRRRGGLDRVAYQSQAGRLDLGGRIQLRQRLVGAHWVSRIVAGRGGQKGVLKEAGHDVDDVNWAILTYADGTVVNLGVSYALPAKYPSLGHAARVEILGTEGVIILDDDHTDQLMYSEKGVPHVYLPDHNVNMVFLSSGTPGDWALGDFWGPIANETRAWLDHLATGKACVHATAQDARCNLEVTLAIQLAAAPWQEPRLLAVGRWCEAHLPPIASPPL